VPRSTPTPAQPALVQNPAEEHRYNAACAAVLAAAGQGEASADHRDRERAALRKQARDWLHADLALWSALAGSPKPQFRAVVRDKLHHWQTDTDLASIRDPDALAKLAETEADECRKLRGDVAAVMKKASDK
jgi:hypothetical protein